jgi:antitoxin Phd
MTVYTRSEAERQLTTVLDRARREGEVRIQGEVGQEFILKPVSRSGSPLDVRGVDVGLTAEQIVDAVRESRER